MRVMSTASQYYFTLRILSTLLGTLVIVLITMVAGFDAATKMVILLVATAKGIETIADVIAGHLQKFERLDPGGTGSHDFVAQRLWPRLLCGFLAYAQLDCRSHRSCPEYGLQSSLSMISALFRGCLAISHSFFLFFLRKTDKGAAFG